MTAPRPIGGIIHTYQKYDPKHFPSPTQPPPDLVSPALEYHPSTEVILQFFSKAVEIERVGVGANWREKLQIMFRLRGAETPL
jgi:hypothetical protein